VASGCGRPNQVGVSRVSVIVTFCFGFCSFFTRFLEKSFAALSALMANVRLQMKSLFRATKSVECVKDKQGFPNACATSFSPFASMVIVSSAFSLCMACLNSERKSAAALSLLTAIMQSPRFVRCESLVISKVVLFVARIFSCPHA
jgi:hypothetical protein